MSAQPTAKPSYSKGLEGVIAGETAICTVTKQGDSLLYRGYSLVDLCKHCQFEEVSYLLTRGHLPNESELKAYVSKLNKYYELSPLLCKILEMIPRHAHPMDILRTTCSVIGNINPESEENIVSPNQVSNKETLDICDRLMATFPSAIAYHYRFHNFKEKIQTKSRTMNDSIAKHFLTHLHNHYTINEKSKITKEMIKCVDCSFICYAEHGFAASTFSCRVTISTLSDAYSAICSAIGTLRGSLHGGANEQALYLIQSYKNKEDAIKGINLKFKNKEKIMGFGHRVYKVRDPRTPIMKDWNNILVKQHFGNKNLMEVSDVIENMLWEQKKLFPNVDYPSAMAYHQCGIPTSLFTPLFVMARTSGWFAHIIEQRSNNRLMRPSALYTGPSLKPVVSIKERQNNTQSKL